MTAEEYFKEWWTPKELPENGFNKTAMLDFAEGYASQQTQGEWISVEDRLPEITLNKMSNWVITFCEDVCRIDKAFYSSVTGWEAEHGEPMNVTHWQPLPPPPKTTTP